MANTEKKFGKLKQVLSEIKLTSPDTSLEKAWKALGDLDALETSTQSEKLVKEADRSGSLSPESGRARG